MPQAKNNFQTVVRNTSASEKFFGFLGAHGVKLAAGATYAVDGDLVGSIKNRRALKSLQEQLAAGVLTVMKTPTVFLETDNVGEVVPVKAGASGSGLVAAGPGEDVDADDDGIVDALES